MINFIISFIDYFDKLRILKFFKKNLDDNKINVIDIGAHKGETIKFFLNNFNVNKIFVFEPNEKLFSKIKKRFVDRRIHLFNLGVGFKNERKNLNLTIDSASSTINEINTNTEYFKRKKKFLVFGKKKSFFLGVQDIEVVNLSEFILKKEKKIDILKIDTEGYEFNILKGIHQLDFKKIRFIYFEHHFDLMIEKKYKFRDINELLKKNNFSLKYKLKMKFRKSFEYIYESK
tara:strand:- start:54 stop:746 length:693 start_codon:yes stop_codon:yes gene_type:complete